MTLKQLKYLIGIVDSGLNITSAAERLYTSQPGISKQLKQLEAELGMQLFTRKGKSLAAITPAGREVIDRARKILREVANITNLASDLTGEQEGTLSIATTHTQARYVLPDVIRTFNERYPKSILSCIRAPRSRSPSLSARTRWTSRSRQVSKNYSPI